LCSKLADLELKEAHPNLAVRWWAQGMLYQESLDTADYGGSAENYLHLHYVAEGLLLPECAEAFLLRADAAEGGGRRLDPEVASDLRMMAYGACNPAIGTVLEELVERYIARRK
jgi:hypothetical protein